MTPTLIPLIHHFFAKIHIVGSWSPPCWGLQKKETIWWLGKNGRLSELSLFSERVCVETIRHVLEIGKYIEIIWLVVDPPSEKYESVGMMTFPIYRKQCSKPPTRYFLKEYVHRILHFNYSIACKPWESASSRAFLTASLNMARVGRRVPTGTACRTCHLASRLVPKTLRTV